MNAEADGAIAPTLRIGEWLFSPAANELCRGGERRKLEHRAARTLELLCARRGEMVSQEEIVREVWDGRAVSPNSVPVVISDLRQALGDDAREPRHIETVAKRGYRLLPEPVEQIEPTASFPARRRPRALLATLALLMLMVLLSLVAIRGSGPSPTPLIVTEVVNDTGRPAYQALASATSEVIMANAQRMDGVEVFRGTPVAGREGAIELRARLIIWSGKPTVTMSAEDETGAVIWTGMTSGKEDLIPREVGAAIDDLASKLPAPKA